MKNYYSVEELKQIAMDALRKCAWDAPVEEVAHYVRAYGELFDRLENKEEEKPHD